MKNFAFKLFSFCLIAISYAMALPALATSTLGQANSNFPMGSNASFQRALYKEISTMPEFRSKKSQMGFGYLRAEAQISNSSGTYAFNIKRTGNETNTERKLDLNDTFVCTHLAIGLIKTSLAAGASNAVIQYYPSYVFTTVPAEQTDLETLYNGYLTIKTNQLTNPEAIPMSIFRNVPVTQQTATTNRAQGAVVSAAAFLGQLPIFRGNQSIEINISAPVFSGILWQGAGTGVENKIVFMPYGYLIKGAAAAITAGDAQL